MYHKQTHKYIDVLDDIVKSYSSTIHRSIKMKPKDVNNKEKEIKLWARQYLRNKIKRKSSKVHFKYNVGGFIQLSYLTNLFSRDFDKKWTGELFKDLVCR